MDAFYPSWSGQPWSPATARWYWIPHFMVLCTCSPCVWFEHVDLARGWWFSGLNGCLYYRAVELGLSESCSLTQNNPLTVMHSGTYDSSLAKTFPRTWHSSPRTREPSSESRTSDLERDTANPLIDPQGVKTCSKYKTRLVFTFPQVHYL